MKTVRNIILVAILGLTAACTKAPAPKAQTSVRLDLTATLAPAPETKGAVFPGESNGSGGYYMPIYSSFGLFVCDHHGGSYTDGSNPYSEYAVRYNNIKAARNNSGEWFYNYYGYSNFATLYLAPKDENNDNITDNTCDFFAYAPHQDGVTALEGIPFSIAEAVDVMYAEQNGVSNLDIDPADYIPTPGHLAVPLTFHHALSLMEFDFTIKNPDFNHPMDPDVSHNYVLQAITLTKSNPTGHLYASGTMNAMRSGELSNLVPADAITVMCLRPNTLSSFPASVDIRPNMTAQAYFLQVPTCPGEDYADGDYVFTFKMSDQTFPVTFTLLREHLKHSDGVTYGFQPGYKYTFHFMIDNYIHLEGITIGEWETVTDPIMQTEI